MQHTTRTEHVEHGGKKNVYMAVLYIHVNNKKPFLAEIENQIACKIQLKRCQNSRIEIPDDFCDHHILR